MNDVDTRSVLKMFAELDSRRQKQAHRSAIRKGVDILIKEARGTLGMAVRDPKSKNWWNGKTLRSGVKASINKEVTEGKVHIMGDFRLKFFEMGTKRRRTSGSNKAKVRGKIPKYRQHKPSNRGSIRPFRFFRRARNQKEKEIEENMTNILAESIKRINAKFKGR